MTNRLLDNSDDYKQFFKLRKAELEKELEIITKIVKSIEDFEKIEKK